MARRTPGRYRRRPLVAALPLPVWEQHARPGTHDDDETDPHTTPAPRDCQGCHDAPRYRLHVLR